MSRSFRCFLPATSARQKKKQKKQTKKRVFPLANHPWGLAGAWAVHHCAGKKKQNQSTNQIAARDKDDLNAKYMHQKVNEKIKLYSKSKITFKII